MGSMAKIKNYELLSLHGCGTMGVSILGKGRELELTRHSSGGETGMSGWLTNTRYSMAVVWYGLPWLWLTFPSKLRRLAPD